MPKPFVSRAQMGWMYRNKPDVYRKKEVAMIGKSIPTMPWRLGSKRLNARGIKVLNFYKAKLSRGSITVKHYEAIFRSLFRKHGRDYTTTLGAFHNNHQYHRKVFKRTYVTGGRKRSYFQAPKKD